MVQNNPEMPIPVQSVTELTKATQTHSEKCA
jgi:hypothetical protein